MSKYKFKYSKILGIKRDSEEEHKRKLASRILDHSRLSEKLRSLEAERRSYFDEANSKMSSGLSSDALWRMESAKKWFKTEIGRYEELVELAKLEIKKAQDELLNANIEVKKLEKLEEKAKLEFKANEEKDMGNMIDEVINFQEVAKRD